MRVDNGPARALANAWRWRLHLPRGVALHGPRASAGVGVREARRSPAAASPGGGNTECGLLIRNGWSVLILIPFQDETNNATLSSWQDHEEPMSSWSHPLGRLCRKPRTSGNSGKPWR